MKKIDFEKTDAASFLDRRSYTDFSGGLHLFGKDMELMRQQVFERDGFKCQMPSSRGLCAKKVSWERGELDHIKSKGQGGDDSEANLRVLCYECHRKRHVHVKWSKKVHNAAEPL